MLFLTSGLGITSFLTAETTHQMWKVANQDWLGFSAPKEGKQRKKLLQKMLPKKTESTRMFVNRGLQGSNPTQ